MPNVPRGDCFGVFWYSIEGIMMVKVTIFGVTVKVMGSVEYRLKMRAGMQGGTEGETLS